MAQTKKRHPFRGLRKVIFCIIKLFLLPYVRLVQNVRFKKNGFKIPKGPVLFISNHQSNWDGIYVNLMFFNRCIYFLMHDELFKYKISKFFFSNLLGMVQRTDSKNNISAINSLIELKDEGQNIGLYPEGDIQYWGKSTPVNKSSAKLIKLLRIPTVLMNVSGAHLRAPRWAKRTNRSRITYEIVSVLTPEEIKTMPIDAIHQSVVNAISYDENEFQKREMIKLHGRSHAENLELGLYVCPECLSFNTLVSKGDSVKCNHCGLSFKMNCYDMLCSYKGLSNGHPSFAFPSEWNDWQKQVLESKIKSSETNSPIFVENNVVVSKAQIDTAFKSYSKAGGKLTMFHDRLEFECEDEEKQIFEYSVMKQPTLQFKAVLEFYYGDVKYRFKKRGELFCAYMWSEAINLMLPESNKLSH